MSIPKIIKQEVKFLNTLLNLPVGNALVMSAPMDDAAYNTDGKALIANNDQLKAAKFIYIYVANQILASGNKKQYAYFFIPRDDPVWHGFKKSSKPDDTVNQS